MAIGFPQSEQRSVCLQPFVGWVRQPFVGWGLTLTEAQRRRRRAIKYLWLAVDALLYAGNRSDSIRQCRPSVARISIPTKKPC